MKKLLFSIICLCFCISSVSAINTTTNTTNTTTTTQTTQTTTDTTTTTDPTNTTTTTDTTTIGTTDSEVISDDSEQYEKVEATKEDEEGSRIVINSKKIVVFIGGLILLYIIFLIIRRPKESLQVSYKEIKDSALNKYIPNIKLSELEDNLANQYIEYLELYKEKNLDKIKKITNSILYEKTRIEFEELDNNNQSKFYDDYTIKERGITSIKLENQRLVSELYLDIEYVDYTKDNLEDKIIEGNQYYREHYIYTLKYYLSKEGKSKLIEINRMKKM